METSRCLAPTRGTAKARSAAAANRSMRNMNPPDGIFSARPRGARVSGHDTVIAMDQAQRFEALLASGKDSALLRFGLGMHYLGAGDAARAAGHLRRAVEQDPAYSAAWKLLGKAPAHSGGKPGALAASRAGIS